MSCQICSVKPIYLLLGLLVLSGFTHLWNAVGFPDIFFDEGVYMRRAMHVLEGLGPQESYFHDHPFFGQIFLASSLAVVGFPNSFHPSANVDSVASLYLAPRILMGLLAIVDTFLIYKIAENRYGTKIALISSLFFAVMPITWLVRRILLDSILLPFLLLSILLALSSKNSSHKNLMVLLSGICMGIAIFTKTPAFAMIPLVAGLVYFYNGKSLKLVALWLLPVVLIPMLWPLQSIEAGQFHLWVGDVLGQTQRHSAGLAYTLYTFFNMDPVLFILGTAGIVFCIFKRDYFILMWLVPFILFLFAIGYNQYFYSIPILPVFCISASVLIARTLGSIKQEKLGKVLPYVLVLGIGAFGLASTMMIITTNMTSGEFQAASFVLQHVRDNDSKTTILASPTYSWIFNDVFHKQNVFLDYSLVLWQKITTQHVLLVVDPHYMIDMGRGKILSKLDNDSKMIASFDGNVQKYDIALYPYTNLKVNYEGSHIEIKEK
ncbi:MAG: glycosyltransferase family 39 protein [Thaumarchaeota archaeon]|nr:glycosyltransferase family 39 protein [Nitrososphaerota archaeon]